MTSVRLAALWFTDAADSTDALAVPVMIESTRTWTVPGQVRTYASGRRRAVRGAGIERTWAPVLGHLPLAQAEDLMGRAGRLHWVRDPVGGRVAAVFYEPTLTLSGILVSGHGEEQHAVVSLALTEVSHREVWGCRR